VFLLCWKQVFLLTAAWSVNKGNTLCQLASLRQSSNEQGQNRTFWHFVQIRDIAIAYLNNFRSGGGQ